MQRRDDFAGPTSSTGTGEFRTTISAPPLLSLLLMMVVSRRVYRHQLIVIEFRQAENPL
jgi:hypothetical protein